MVNGKKLYAYNKDTGRREELQVEASSITFKNSLDFEKFTGSTDTEDGFGGGFFPTPLKTHRGTYVDSNNVTQTVPFFLASDGTWRYAVTDTSMYLRKDEAASLYVGVDDKIAAASQADNATFATTASSAGKLANSVKVSVNLESDTASVDFNGETDIAIGVTGILPETKGGTGATSLNDIVVGAASKATSDSQGNDISTTYQKKPVKGTFSIAASQWVQDSMETESEFVLYYDINVTGVTTDYMPTVVVDKKSQAVAVEAGFFGAAESLPNKIRVRCKERPSSNISGSYYAFEV